MHTTADLLLDGKEKETEMENMKLHIIIIRLECVCYSPLAAAIVEDSIVLMSGCEVSMCFFSVASFM